MRCYLRFRLSYREPQLHRSSARHCRGAIALGGPRQPGESSIMGSIRDGCRRFLACRQTYIKVKVGFNFTMLSTRRDRPSPHVSRHPMRALKVASRAPCDRFGQRLDDV
jgi:hypothetical protein